MAGFRRTDDMGARHADGCETATYTLAYAGRELVCTGCGEVTEIEIVDLCPECREWPLRGRRRYCSDACRQRAYRRRVWYRE